MPPTLMTILSLSSFRPISPFKHDLDGALLPDLRPRKEETHTELSIGRAGRGRAGGAAPEAGQESNQRARRHRGPARRLFLLLLLLLLLLGGARGWGGSRSTGRGGRRRSWQGRSPRRSARPCKRHRRRRGSLPWALSAAAGLDLASAWTEDCPGNPAFEALNANIERAARKMKSMNHLWLCEEQFVRCAEFSKQMLNAIADL